MLRGTKATTGAAVAALVSLLTFTTASTSFTDALFLGERENKAFLKENFNERSIVHGNLTRWFLEYKQQQQQSSVTTLSTTNASAAKAPLVILLHGGTRSMRTLFLTFYARPSFEARPWLTLCDTHGAVLLAPNGANPATGDTYGDEQVWNDFRDDDGKNSTIDDVGFLAALVDWAVNVRGGIDEKRVYLTGISNGGMMTYRAIIESTTAPTNNAGSRPKPLYAAGAVFTANLPSERVVLPMTLNPATPMFIMNGNKDKIVPWNGGTVGFIGGTARSTPATLDYWIRANNADASKVQRATLPNRRFLDRCRIHSDFYPATVIKADTTTKSSKSSNSYRGTASNTTTGISATINASITSAPVQFYTMDGGGHMVPYTNRSLAARYALFLRYVGGPPCHDANGADLAWDFLSRYTLQEE